MSTRNGKVKEIWGRQFRLVKNGLDESDVFAFVGRLIEENHDLAAKLEHVSSLRRLAERSVVQAAKEAGRIKKEAEDEARLIAASVSDEASDQGRIEAERLIAEAEKGALHRISASEEEARRIITAADPAAATQVDRLVAAAQQETSERPTRIIAEAEEEAQARAEKIIAEAGDAARAHAESIVTDMEQRAQTTAKETLRSAEQRAAILLGEAEEKLRELQAPAAAEADNLIAEARQSIEAAERKARELLAEAQEKAEAIRSQAEQEATAFIEELKQKADTAAEVRIAKAEEEGRRIIEESIKTARLEAERIAEEAEEATFSGQMYEETDLRAKFEVLLDLLVSNSLGTRERPRPPVRQSQRPSFDTATMPQADVDDMIDDDPNMYHGPVELDFPPPLNSGRVLKIHKWLAKVPGCRVIDLEGSSRGGIRIKVYVTGRVPLCDLLQENPEVERVSDGVRPSRASQAGGKAPPRRIVVATHG